MFVVFNAGAAEAVRESSQSTETISEDILT